MSKCLQYPRIKYPVNMVGKVRCKVQLCIQCDFPQTQLSRKGCVYSDVLTAHSCLSFQKMIRTSQKSHTKGLKQWTFVISPFKNCCVFLSSLCDWHYPRLFSEFNLINGGTGNCKICALSNCADMTSNISLDIEHNIFFQQYYRTLHD